MSRTCFRLLGQGGGGRGGGGGGREGMELWELTEKVITAKCSDYVFVRSESLFV